ncbi:MAG TPA: acyl-CoA dehydrogenase family protein, partial [Mycobacterium sp.]|nr:acyl-CoA dehydrogenase family protein [Mycobacterium sp.]
MSSTEALNHVIAVAAANADQVDAEGSYPLAAVDALRGSGLLGLILHKEVGGLGAGPKQFVDVVGTLAAACGSTAMIYLMHTAAAVTVAAAPPPCAPELLYAMASGKALGTLAFSERGSRSHFWAPVSTAALSDDGTTVKLRADKSWVTSAGYADMYIVSTGSTSGVAGEVDLYALPMSV